MLGGPPELGSISAPVDIYSFILKNLFFFGVEKGPEREDLAGNLMIACSRMGYT
jgi:hypothetical protein